LNGVDLESNVYIRFEPGVTIISPRQGVAAAFELADGIENVSLVGPATFNVINPIDEEIEHRAFTLHGVRNFEIDNFVVNDSLSRFCAIIMSPRAFNVDGAIPRRGSISNLTVNRAAGGFGGIQIHAARRVNFNNIESTGGVSLRFESGIENNSGIGGINGEDIRSINGRAATLFQPHALNHGTVRLQNVSSVGSAFAVILRNGFEDENSA